MLISDSIQDEQVNEAQSLHKELEQIQILIAESEKELQSLFRTYLSSLGMSIKTAKTGHETLGYYLDSKKNGRPYSAIVLDTHLANPSGLDVAKRIHSENLDQKMVIVTTTPVQYLPQDCLKTAGIEAKDILIMLFRMSELMTALKN